MCIIRLESDPILLLDVHCSNSYVHWRLGYLSNNCIRCSNSFLFIPYKLFHPFWFILESDFTPCMARCSNSYRKYFSILYRERSTVQTSITVEFSPFVFYIYRRNKKNNRLDERITCERPVKCSYRCSDGTRLQGWKKRKHVRQKRKKVRWIKNDITIVLFFPFLFSWLYCSAFHH
jgi:hypothetical protein